MDTGNSQFSLGNKEIKDFYALEGGVCSGKTSISRILHESYNWEIIPEFMEFVSPSTIIEKPFLPAKKRLDLFTDIEITRQSYISNGKKTITDRSIFSIIAFEIALIEMGVESELCSYNFPDQICIPSHTFYLSVTNDERRSRWIEREKESESIFINISFNNSIEKFFRKIQNIVPLTILDSEISTDQLKIVKYINDFRMATNRQFTNITVKQLISCL